MFVIYIPKLNCYLAKQSTKNCLICADSIESKNILKFRTFDNALKKAINLVERNKLDFEIVDFYKMN